MPLNAAKAAQAVIGQAPAACESLNQFSADVFRTRGGRIGSGMGGVIEALWGFYLNRALQHAGVVDIEIAWIYGHEYNDFACIGRGAEWDPETRKGELFRIEAKSMVAAADESKAHFDRLVSELDTSELLAVFLWDWVPVAKGSKNVHPRVQDHFIGPALPIAQLRDSLHIERGGSFVQGGRCPDGCAAKQCSHVGEPLNAAGIRERRTGPLYARGKNVSYAANFGGLLRMLGSRGTNGQRILAEWREKDASARSFIDFMARNFSRVSRRIL